MTLKKVQCRRVDVPAGHNSAQKKLSFDKKKKIYFYFFNPESGSGLALKSVRDRDPDRSGSGFSGYRDITNHHTYVNNFA